MKILREIWEDIRTGQNLDIYITVALSVIIAILGITGKTTQEIIFSAILATLALISSGLLVNRHQNEETQKLISTIKNETSLSENFFVGEDNIAEIIHLIRKSRKVYFWGTTLTTHIPILEDELEKGLENGLEVRFLLIKPEGVALKMAAFRGKDLSEKDLESDLRRNLARLSAINSHAPQGKFECRVVDYLAPYTMYIFDMGLSSGIILVRISALRTPNTMRPTFRLTQKDDSKWFEFHAEQFETAWKEATPPNP
jgi:hypothetical protein